MTEPGRPRKLSSIERNSLIARVRQEGGRETSHLLPAQTHRIREADSFENLPGYGEIRVQMSVAREIGIETPFYRIHDAKAGAATVVSGSVKSNFTSYDYLGLNGHPEIAESVANAARTWGTSVSASRLTSGERPFHSAFEATLARHYNAQAALLFVSGHATNLALVGSVVGSGDLLLHDALAHNSIVIGGEMSGAHRRSFAHNDLDQLDQMLATQRQRYRHCLIATEGLFSMDGDGPDLARLIEIKRRHGAWLMIDEAHSLGVLGPTGAGLFEHFGIDPAEVDIWMGTLSKTLVSCGGYVAAPAPLIDVLKYRAPGMVYSVGISAPAAYAAMTAFDIMLREPGRVARLQANGKHLLERARDRELPSGSSWGSAVAPIMTGDSLQTVLLAEQLLARGFAVVPVIPPGVPEKLARLRLFLSADHSTCDIDKVIDVMADERDAVIQAGVSVSSFAGTTLAARFEATSGELP